MTLAKVDHERRSHPRVSLDTEVWVGEDGVFTRTNERLGDISVGGAFLESPDFYAIGAIISLRFRLGSDYVTATALVRNARPGRGIGVQFLDLSPENAERLQSLVVGRVRSRF